jgi:hypothetical protein
MKIVFHKNKHKCRVTIEKITLNDYELLDVFSNAFIMMQRVFHITFGLLKNHPWNYISTVRILKKLKQPLN